jgi:hypothetical protein
MDVISLLRLIYPRGRRGRDGMIVVFTTGHCVPMTTKVVSSNPVHGEVYFTQHYVIKLVSYLRQVGGYYFMFCSIMMRIINVSFKTGTNEIYNILKRNISFNFLFFSRISSRFKAYIDNSHHYGAKHEIVLLDQSIDI